jgi:membrane protease YdiL (CAAX protease family)
LKGMRLTRPSQPLWRYNMTLGFGPDFWAAQQRGLYVARSGQSLLVASVLLVTLVLALTLLQGIFSMVLRQVLPVEVLVENSNDFVALQTALVKSMVLGLLPASLVAAAITWVLAGKFNATGDRGIPLHVPKLGVLGWVCLTVGMLLTMWAVFTLTFLLLGIDPATYAPSKEVLSDVNSAAGMVEKAMADLSRQPVLFAIAMPGVTVAVPLVEELIFRGAIFSALRNSWFGKTGAVVITAAAWAAVHAVSSPLLFVFIIFIMGLALGLLLLRFGSLWVTIVCHCAWNAFSSIAIFGSQLPQ